MNKKILFWLPALSFLLFISIMIVDARRVIFILPSAQPLHAELGEPFSPPAASAYSVGRIFPQHEMKVSVLSEVDTGHCGSYTVKYMSSYFIRTFSAEQLIEVSRTEIEEPAAEIDDIIPVQIEELTADEGKIIYLSFDDGPSEYTAELLDILAQYDVKASFFVTASYPEYAGLIAREYSEGHTVAVHSYSHDYYRIYASEEAYLEDFCAMQELIYEQAGIRPKLFRFPGGSSNTVSRFNSGIMTRLTSKMSELGYVYFDWNVSSGDAGETCETEKVYENIINGCTDKDEALVLQHDTKKYSVDAVESVIQWGLENGYSFRALDETSCTAHHGVAN